LFSVGPGGGTIDNEGSAALSFTNTGSLGMSGNGPRTLTLTGPGTAGDTIASAIVNHPAGTTLRKQGTGLWILTGTNTYAGGTTLAGGTLQIGAGGQGGTLGNGDISTLTGTAIDFQRAGTVTVPGSIDGGGSVTVNGSGTVILANNNGYNGGTTINAGTLQIGNGGASGSLNPPSAILNNSLLVFNTSGSTSLGFGANGIISGSGNVIFQGGGTIKAIGNNSYTGWTRIDSGTTFFCREGQDGALLTSVITNNGTLRMVEQNTPGFTYNGPIVGSGRVQAGANNVNVGVMILGGTNSYSGGTFIGGNELRLGDNFTAGGGTIVGNVQFVNNFTTSADNVRTLTFNRPSGDDFTFSGTITTNFTSAQGNMGIVQLLGGATVTLTANNTYAGGTLVNNGALIVGNGGASGSLGFGTNAINNGSTLVINRSGTMTPLANISGTAASLYLTGGATVTLNGVNNTYSGSTTVTNGTLIVNGANATSSTIVYAGAFGGAGTFSGPVTLQPGVALRPGAAGAVGTLTVNNDLTFGGNVAIELNKSLSPTSDRAVVSGILTNTGTGTITVLNLGPALQPGDTFTLFSQPLQNGAALTVTGSGATWVNNLAVNGTITANTVTRPTLGFSQTTTNMQFSWDTTLGNYKLQAQTNSITVGISTNWVDYTNGNISPITVPLNKTNATVFFRLISPP
jgi:autotransporter-associated beta strand protein